MSALLQAIAFLTVLPVPGTRRDGFSSSMVRWFPAVGFLVGGLLMAAELALQPVPASLAAILLIGLWLAVTGCLHLDGWIDACDAMAPGLSREQARAAMKDPRAGAMGVAGAFVLLATKWTALASITVRRGVWVLLAAVAARWAVATLLVFAPAADPGDGLGARVRRELSARDVVLPMLTVVLLLPIGNAATVAACLAATAVATAAVAAALRRRTGRLNGDVYGAAVEACETLILLIGAVVTS